MKRPIVALMYDFDRTLCTKDMQEYGFIESVGMSANEFGKKLMSLLIHRVWTIFGVHV